MASPTRHIILVWLLYYWAAPAGWSQQRDTINWLTFEQLSDSLDVQPKRVLISFHTDWCAYCRKMHQEVYTRPEVVAAVNGAYYAVQFDAESTDTVRFDGQVFANSRATSRRRAFHDLALILGSRGHRFSVPVTIVLDEEFNVISRHFDYLDSKKLLAILE